jgi:Zn-dependent peptidase ImmA (M78 family)/DNA-binding XRE family transcriptional regulator
LAGEETERIGRIEGIKCALENPMAVPRKSLEVSINPGLLVWARESTGKDIGEVAKKLGVSQDTVRRWESGEERPGLVEMEKLAEVVYKRPLAVFFLSEPPKEPPLPRDFRILPSGTEPPLSPRTRLVIRQAQRTRRLASDMSRDLGRRITPSLRKVSLSDDPERLAAAIRRDLAVKDGDQSAWRDEEEALRAWIKTIEAHGVLVFQMGFPMEDARGFSLADGAPPAIVLNRRDSTRGRIFSLFHEYCHLLLNDGGICRIDERKYREDEDRVERFCNRLAAEVLVPKDVLLGHPLVSSGSARGAWRDDVLGRLAGVFKVSKEVVLRRLLTFRLTTQRFYEEKREEWAKKTQRGWGRQNPSKKCVQERGVAFVSLVLEAQRRDRITYSDVADYLGIRLKLLPKVEQLVSEGA